MKKIKTVHIRHRHSSKQSRSRTNRRISTHQSLERTTKSIQRQNVHRQSSLFPSKVTPINDNFSVSQLTIYPQDHHGSSSMELMKSQLNDQSSYENHDSLSNKLQVENFDESFGNVSYMHTSQSAIRKHQRSNTKKTGGKVSNNNWSKPTDKTLKNQKHKTCKRCRCTPLCVFLSILGPILLGVALSAILIGTLLPRTSKTIITTTTTATTATTVSTSTTTSTSSSSSSSTSSTSTTSTSSTSTTSTTSQTTSTSSTSSSSTSSSTSTTSQTTSTSSTSSSSTSSSTSTTSQTTSTSSSSSSSTSSSTTTTSVTTTTTRTTTSTTTTVICSPTCLNGGTCVLPNNTCICNEEVWIGPRCETPVRILWTFDNNLLDFYGNFPGTPINNPTYQTPGINGYGSCLYLSASASQSVTIPTPPFLNMAYTSFSLSVWVKANTFRTSWICICCDNAIFGQFDQNTGSRSLHIIVRNKKIYFGFYSDDTQGSIDLSANAWYHMAYVYDYSIRTQYVYVNGILDNSNSFRGPYKGINGDLTIGTNGVCAPSNTWDGCLDQISYFARAKSAAEVLRDATLTVSYTFNNTLLDDGPLGINGTGTNVQYSSSGQANAAINISANPSFVQASGLVYLGTDGHPYSIALWIRPMLLTSGTIVHVSPSSGATTWSMPMLGFLSTGQIRAQGCSSSGVVALTGPVPTLGVWTHIAITYSQSTRLRLWINGTQIATSSTSFVSSTIDAPVTITLGATPISTAGPCAATSIILGQYRGLLDEFQLYSRELTAAEVFDLAN